MRVTTNGQVTIPAHIRKKLGLLPNTEVEIDVVGDTARIRKVRRRSPSLVAHLRGRATRRMSTDEIMAITRE